MILQRRRFLQANMLVNWWETWEGTTSGCSAPRAAVQLEELPGVYGSLASFTRAGFFSRPWGGVVPVGKSAVGISFYSRHSVLTRVLCSVPFLCLQCPPFWRIHSSIPAVSCDTYASGFIRYSFFSPSSKETKKPLAHSVEKIETTSTAVFYFCPAVTLQETGTQGQWVLREVVGGVQENASPWGLEKLAWLLVDDPCSYRRKRGQPVAYTHG